MTASVPRDSTSILDLFIPLLHQQGRLLQMRSALPWLSLIPERMRLLEALGQPFEISLQCLSPSAHLPLNDLLGEQVSLWLLQPDGTERPWHAYIHSASQLGADGGLARYQLALRPWLSTLGLRRNSRVFHDLSVSQVLETAPTSTTSCCLCDTRLVNPSSCYAKTWARSSRCMWSTRRRSQPTSKWHRSPLWDSTACPTISAACN